jgi:peptidoglycan/LPS O-acetylase OafA/YrhL
MYVLHPAWIVAPLYKKHPGSTGLMWAALLLGPPVSYGIAVLSWNLLERHFLALKCHFPYKLNSAAKGLDANEPQIVLAG